MNKLQLIVLAALFITMSTFAGVQPVQEQNNYEKYNVFYNNFINQTVNIEEGPRSIKSAFDLIFEGFGNTFIAYSTNVGARKDNTINPDFEIYLPNLKNVSRKTVFELVLEQYDELDLTWQFRRGLFEVGPKVRFNDLKNRTGRETYYVSDLISYAKNFINAPELDINSSLVPDQDPIFGQPKRGAFVRLHDREEVLKLIELIKEEIEPSYWEENPNNIRYFRLTLHITAPEYIHRQLRGLPFYKPLNVEK